MRALTPQQQRVAHEVGKGLGAREVAERLGIEISTVRAHIQAIALRLPNPDEIPAYRLVTLHAAREQWLAAIGAQARFDEREALGGSVAESS